MVRTDSSERSMALAYLTTAYPSISHTFIRREIAALERLGYVVHRYAIRRGDVADDPADLKELTCTYQLLEQPKLAILCSALSSAISSPLASIRAMMTAIQMSKLSERGLFTHVAYVVEALALLREFRKKNISHVHVHFGTNAATVAMLVNQMGGPSFSMTVHGPDEFDAPIALDLKRKIAASRFTVAISSYCSAQLRRWAAAEDWHKIKVVHCVVDAFWFEVNEPLARENSTYVSIGRLSAQKGQLLLVDAIAGAVQRGFTGRVLLIGDGELRAAIEQRIKSLNVQDFIQIVGWCSSARVRELLISSRALLLPSFAEGLPMVLMEAMAVQRPVVASSIAGIPELVRPGVDGWLTIAGDIESFVSALIEIDKAPLARLLEMGASARERVRERHDADRQAAQLAAHLSKYADVRPARTTH